MKKKLRIFHETHYGFESGVFIEPHYLRFKPETTPYNTLEKFELKIIPTPVGLSQQYDAENNLVHFCWFDGIHESLSIQSTSEVVLLENNPFDFILFPNEYFDLPFNYSSSVKDMLYPSLIVSEISKPLIEYGKDMLVQSSSKTLHFISNLTRQIQEDFIVESRLEGEPFDADQTFELKRASCRDLSWMQIQLLRYMGIASRFVSGYYFIDTARDDFELHGWIEVFLPGAGWIGFDPSNGIIAGSSHIPICSGSQYQNTMPVTGSFRGSAKSELTTNLSILQVLREINQ